MTKDATINLAGTSIVLSDEDAKLKVVFTGFNGIDECKDFLEELKQAASDFELQRKDQTRLSQQ